MRGLLSRRLIGLCLLVWPFLEIAVLIWVGALIGLGWTLLALLIGVVAGVLIIQHGGRRAVVSITDRLRRGEAPRAELGRTGRFMLVGILLIIPGFLTDVVAVLVMVIPTRLLVSGAGRQAFVTTGGASSPMGDPRGDEPRVVRGDVVDRDT